MIDEITNLLDEYRGWLAERSPVQQIGNVVEVTTPYLDRHNDYIQLYVLRRDDELLLSDYGETVEDLVGSGVNVTQGFRRQLLQSIVNRFGVGLSEELEMSVQVPPDRFSLAKQSLIQAILAANDLAFTAEADSSATPKPKEVFDRDVTGWLDDKKIPYEANGQYQGKTGFSRTFSFVIRARKSVPETLIQTLHQPSRLSAERLLFDWVDTAASRPARCKGVALLNDESGSVQADIVSALKSYRIGAIPWSESDALVRQLTE